MKILSSYSSFFQTRCHEKCPGCHFQWHVADSWTVQCTWLTNPMYLPRWTHSKEGPQLTCLATMSTIWYFYWNYSPSFFYKFAVLVTCHLHALIYLLCIVSYRCCCQYYVDPHTRPLLQIDFMGTKSLRSCFTCGYEVGLCMKHWFIVIVVSLS